MNNKNSRLCIIVLGYIIRGPIGGMAWHHLQYVLGLAQLGHEVYFIEDSDDYPSCYNPHRHIVDTDPAYGMKFMESAMNRLGLGDYWAYYDAHSAQWMGPLNTNVLGIAQRCDLILNISGVNPLRQWFHNIPRRVFIDTDPVFTQIRIITDSLARERALEHNIFLSFGENITGKNNKIPDDGLPWKPTRQPVVLDAWPVTKGHENARYTTVMQWDSYKKIQYNGQRYGMKSNSFLPLVDLPNLSGKQLELALGTADAPRDILRRNGWYLQDPLAVTEDPWIYQKYIEESKGEFSVAKQGYVVSRSGWFSERSAAYLASGRPVIVQDTGFSDWMETGSGVIPFGTLEEAKAGLDEADSRYEYHCRAAREVAEIYFDSRRVLSNLIEVVFRGVPYTRNQ